jgi:hypothetical protein
MNKQMVVTQALHEVNHGTGFMRRPVLYQMRHAVRVTRLDIFLVWFYGDLMFLVSTDLEHALSLWY